VKGDGKEEGNIEKSQKRELGKEEKKVTEKWKSELERK
jgi:hypothetical protein